jgi:hypothetical protein
MVEKVIDSESCICEGNKICEDGAGEDTELEFPDCFKANPEHLCCKYCPALMKTCNSPCDGIYKDNKNEPEPDTELINLLRSNGYEVTVGAEETLRKIKELGEK